MLYSVILFLEIAMPGELPQETIAGILKSLPMDVTFVDEHDIIRYYSDYRIFSRTPEILGTTVQNCHSQASRAEVDRVMGWLKSGAKDVSGFSAEKNGRKVRGLYIAVKDEKGRYAGMLETAEWID
jgi:DUF438 domain-containing protein